MTCRPIPAGAWRGALLSLLLAGAATAAPPAPATPDATLLAPGLHEDVVFEEYPEAALATALLGRVMSPLWNAQMQQRIAGGTQQLQQRSLEPARERFSVYVPGGHAPANGYALLVFISPFDRPALPARWFAALDRHAVIAVSAVDSGNEQNVLERRMPLALIAAANLRQRFPIDPARSIVGGLSGGSRVALRLALAYPDLFNGALLNAGSDRFGSEILPPPQRGLFERVETATRLVYATGSLDTANIGIDAHSRDSARALCIDDLVELPMRKTGHALLDAATLERALQELEAPRPAPANLAACRAQRNATITTRLDAVQALIGRDADGARAALRAVDHDYAGLAMPRSLELAHTLGLDQPPAPGAAH